MSSRFRQDGLWEIRIWKLTKFLLMSSNPLIGFNGLMNTKIFEQRALGALIPVKQLGTEVLPVHYRLYVLQQPAQLNQIVWRFGPNHLKQADLRNACRCQLLSQGLAIIGVRAPGQEKGDPFTPNWWAFPWKETIESWTRAQFFWRTHSLAQL